ncbi:hypothetical protein AB0E12_13560 [Micromonospora chersina]|uniref:hypothetical protein n=1 Tax=Micromonospora chersina TaxID=47854 RepID=UPI0033FB0C4E
MTEWQSLALSFVKSTNVAQDLVCSLLVVLVTAFLVAVAARSIRQEHRGQDVETGFWDPLGSIKKYPRYSISIMSLVLLGGLLSLVGVLAQLR